MFWVDVSKFWKSLTYMGATVRRKFQWQTNMYAYDHIPDTGVGLFLIDIATRDNS